MKFSGGWTAFDYICLSTNNKSSLCSVFKQPLVRFPTRTFLEASGEVVFSNLALAFDIIIVRQCKIEIVHGDFRVLPSICLSDCLLGGFSYAMIMII